MGIKHGTTVQSTTLSTDESEYYALLRSSAHALEIEAMLSDWCYGVKCEIHMRCDSFAARVISARQGKVQRLRAFLVATRSSARKTSESAQCPDKREPVRHIHAIFVSS